MKANEFKRYRESYLMPGDERLLLVRVRSVDRETIPAQVAIADAKYGWAFSESVFENELLPVIDITRHGFRVGEHWLSEDKLRLIAVAILEKLGG
jgi:hypothetical protein